MQLYQLLACRALISGAFVCVVVRSQGHAHPHPHPSIPRHNEEDYGEPTPEETAWVQLPSMRKEGPSLHTFLYSNPLTAIKAAKGNPLRATAYPFDHSGSNPCA